MVKLNGMDLGTIGYSEGREHLFLDSGIVDFYEQEFGI